MPRRFNPGGVMESMPSKEYYSLNSKAKLFAKENGISETVAHTVLLYKIKYPNAPLGKAIKEAERFWTAPRMPKRRK